MAGLRFDKSGFVAGLTRVQQRQLYAIETYAKAAGNRMLGNVKSKHPWKNRTYSAERSSTVSAAWHGHVMRIALSSGVHYGVFLEFKRFRHAGRLHIYFPTVRQFAPEVLSGWAKVMGG